MSRLAASLVCLRAAPSLGSVLRRLAFVPMPLWFRPWDALLFLAVRPYTMLSKDRLASLYGLARKCNREGIPGAFVECGVWKGGSGVLLASQARGRRVLLLDSFAGLPVPDAGDVDRYGNPGEAGDCCADEADARHILHALSLTAELWQGWYEDTLKGAAATLPGIALLHLDCDWYESIRLCLDVLYPLISPGGVIVVDDYHFWRGCQRAVDEYRAEHRITSPLSSVKTAVWWQVP